MVFLTLYFNKLGKKDDFLGKCKNSYSHDSYMVTRLEKVEMVVIKPGSLCYRSCDIYSRNVTYCRWLLILKKKKKKKQKKHDIAKIIIFSSLD